MHTIHFHKSACGVDLLMNVGTFNDFVGDFFTDEVHNTDFFEIIFFRRGKGTLILDTRTIELCDNLLVFISPYEKRQWKVNPEDIDAGYLIFQEEFLNDFFSDQFFSYRMLFFYQQHYPVHMATDQPFMDMLKKLCEEMKHELVHPKFDSAHIIRALLYYLLTKINRDYCTLHELSTQTPITTWGYQYKRMLEEHIREWHLVDDYVKEMHLSRVTLNKVVKEQYNVSASHLLKQRLVQEIKKELLYTHKTVDEIAHELNFSEPQHLIRFFKNNVGITPLTYRNAEGQID